MVFFYKVATVGGGTLYHNGVVSARNEKSAIKKIMNSGDCPSDGNWEVSEILPMRDLLARGNGIKRISDLV